MRKQLFVIVPVFLILGLGISCARKQSADDFTRISTKVPDIHDEKDGWVHNVAADLVYPDKFGGQLREEIYQNKEKDLKVFLYVYQNKEQVVQELFIDYGGPKVGRAAIKIGDRWYIAKEPFYDNGIEKLEYKIKESFLMDDSANPIGLKLSLQTLGGPKELVLYLVNREA